MIPGTFRHGMTSAEGSASSGVGTTWTRIRAGPPASFKARSSTPGSPITSGRARACSRGSPQPARSPRGRCPPRPPSSSPPRGVVPDRSCSCSFGSRGVRKSIRLRILYRIAQRPPIAAANRQSILWKVTGHQPLRGAIQKTGDRVGSTNIARGTIHSARLSVDDSPTARVPGRAWMHS